MGNNLNTPFCSIFTFLICIVIVGSREIQVDPNSAHLKLDLEPLHVIARQAVEPEPTTPQTENSTDYYYSSNEEVLDKTTQDPTPMIFFSGVLSHGFPCSAYGSEINRVQTGSLSTQLKREILKGRQTLSHFGSKICNWLRARLECVPEWTDPDATTTEDSANSDGGGLPPVGKGPGGDSGSDDKNNGVGFVPNVFPKGHCKCMHSLGEKAVWLVADNPKDSRCYIPANMGRASECEHDVPLPYGLIDEIYRARRNVGPASSMCVPHAECRTGYRYTGVRCRCNKGTVWSRLNGTCNGSLALWDRNSYTWKEFMMAITVSIMNFIQITYS